MKQITNNRIESIKQFLEDFRNRDPEHWFTQFIIDSGFLDYYKNQLMQEYIKLGNHPYPCLLYTSPSPRDRTRSRMPSSA